MNTDKASCRGCIDINRKKPDIKKYDVKKIVRLMDFHMLGFGQKKGPAMYHANSDHATNEIGEGANLVFETILSRRCNLELSKVHDTTQEMYRFVEKSGLNAVGPIIVTLHSGSVYDDSVLLDLEFSLPLPEKIAIKSPYSLLPSFTISNAIYKRHTGSIAALGRTYETLYEYCAHNKLQPVTGIHHIAASPPSVNFESDEFCIDVYIGTRPYKEG